MGVPGLAPRKSTDIFEKLLLKHRRRKIFACEGGGGGGGGVGERTLVNICRPTI